MKKMTVRFTDDHIEIFKKLIEDDQAGSFQDLIIKLIDTTLNRKYGIVDVKSWYRYKKDDQHEYPYISRKDRKKAKSGLLESIEPQVIQTNNSTQEHEISIKPPRRSRINQSINERMLIEQNEDVYETWEELNNALISLTNKDKWDEANRIAERNRTDHEEQLTSFFIAYQEKA